MKEPLAELRRFLNNIATAKLRGVVFPEHRVDGSINAPYIVGDKYCIQVYHYTLGEKQPAQILILLESEAIRLLASLEQYHDIRYAPAKVGGGFTELTQNQLVHFLSVHNLRIDHAPKVVE